jgi:hypothetical protein
VWLVTDRYEVWSTHLHLVPRSWISRSYNSSTPAPPWCVCSQAALPLPLCSLKFSENINHPVWKINGFPQDTSESLNQCFPTRVPWNPRVPEYRQGFSEKSWNIGIYISSLQINFLEIIVNCAPRYQHFLACRVPQDMKYYFRGSSMEKRSWETLVDTVFWDLPRLFFSWHLKSDVLPKHPFKSCDTN